MKLRTDYSNKIVLKMLSNESQTSVDGNRKQIHVINKGASIRAKNDEESPPKEPDPEENQEKEEEEGPEANSQDQNKVN